MLSVFFEQKKCVDVLAWLRHGMAKVTTSGRSSDLNLGRAWQSLFKLIQLRNVWKDCEINEAINNCRLIEDFVDQIR